MHYMRWYRTGSPDGAPRFSPEERFFQYVEERPNGCWMWTAYERPDGYGSFSLGRGRRLPAHRWIYEHMRADIPVGLQIDHLCGVRLCVNPWHLEPVPQLVNLARRPRENFGNNWARRTHCSRGHEYTEENTARTKKSGARVCRTCQRERMRRCRALTRRA